MKKCFEDEVLKIAREEKFMYSEWQRHVNVGRNDIPKPQTPNLKKLDVGINIGTTCGCNCPCQWVADYVTDNMGNVLADMGGYMHVKDNTPAGQFCKHGEV
jgi:hypothetical protein